MGLEEVASAGVDIEDLHNIFKGHIVDRYQVPFLNPPPTTFFMSIMGFFHTWTFSLLASKFSPSGPLMPDSPGYNTMATLNDKIHCIAYVVDTCKASILTQKMLDKFDMIRKKASQMGQCHACVFLLKSGRQYSGISPGVFSSPSPVGIPQILLMTKVDEACSLVADDLKTIYHSVYIQKKVNVSDRAVKYSKE